MSEPDPRHVSVVDAVRLTLLPGGGLELPSPVTDPQTYRAVLDSLPQHAAAGLRGDDEPQPDADVPPQDRGWTCLSAQPLISDGTEHPILNGWASVRDCDTLVGFALTVHNLPPTAAQWLLDHTPVDPTRPRPVVLLEWWEHDPHSTTPGWIEHTYYRVLRLSLAPHVTEHRPIRYDLTGEARLGEHQGLRLTRRIAEVPQSVPVPAHTS